MDSRAVPRIALMSIHPEFAEALMNGTKLVEFRRVVPKSLISHVIVYATRPVMGIVGAIEIERYDSATPGELWTKYGNVGGIRRGEFFRYFAGRNQGTALVVKRVLRCKEPLPLGGAFPMRPPQSFMYLEPCALERVQEAVSRSSRTRTRGTMGMPQREAGLA